MVDFDADGRGVDGAGFAGVLAFELQFRSGARAQKAEGIEVAFKISPLAKGAEDAFAFRVGAIAGRRLDDGGAGGLRFWGSHRESVTRITDARRDAGDSGHGKSNWLRTPRRRRDHLALQLSM